jgi:hypothetical protein
MNKLDADLSTFRNAIKWRELATWEQNLWRQFLNELGKSLEVIGDVWVKELKINSKQDTNSMIIDVVSCIALNGDNETENEKTWRRMEMIKTQWICLPHVAEIKDFIIEPPLHNIQTFRCTVILRRDDFQ